MRVALLIVGLFSTYLNGYSSLVVVMPSNRGLVVCADKRVHDAVLGDRNDMLKVRPLGKWTALAVTNHFALRQAHADASGHIIDERDAFNAYDVVTGYYSTRPISLAGPDFTDLANYVHHRLLDAIPVFGLGNMPDTRPREHILFIVILLSSKGVPYRMASLRFLFTRKPFWTSVSGGAYSENMLQWATPLAFGNTAVVDELTRGNDKRFADARSDPLLHPFVVELHPAARVTPEEAEATAQALIRVSGERSGVITRQDDAPIGLTCDCALLDTATGFQWLDRNHSLKSR